MNRRHPRELGNRLRGGASGLRLGAFEQFADAAPLGFERFRQDGALAVLELFHQPYRLLKAFGPRQFPHDLPQPIDDQRVFRPEFVRLFARLKTVDHRRHPPCVHFLQGREHAFEQAIGR